MSKTHQAERLDAVVVLAAGKGSRMKSDLPKVLHPIGGRPMLHHVLETAVALSPQRIVCVVGHGTDRVQASAEACIAAHPATGLRFALQDPPQGTGHAMQCALSVMADGQPEGLCLVLYGDVPLIRAETLRKLLSAAAGAHGFALLTAELADPRGYGRIVRDAQGQILGCVEEKDASADQRNIREVNTGFVVLPKAQMGPMLARLSNDNAQGEYYLTDLVAMAHAQGTPMVGVAVSDFSETLGVNSQSQRADLERRFQALQAEALMAEGVSLADPGRIDVRGQLLCGRDVHVDVGCVFEGRVVLGDGVRIGPHCVLVDVEVQAGARIEAFSHLQKAVVGPQAVVGPYARLRPGTVLGEGSHVGNFTELKATELGAHSKANHLSYLGDATIGAHVNVGAGTITCNYDGANKHRTIIEDGAFIGSDSQLVAPVTVHAGATIGAGTTLTSDAPADQLTLSRSRQTSIARWKRPKKVSH